MVNKEEFKKKLKEEIDGDVYILRDRYEFRPIAKPLNVYDAIVIRHLVDDLGIYKVPVNVLQRAPSLDEHINFINQMELEKAIIISSDISFISQCPSLKYLEIIPTYPDGRFDFSPLYEIPEIKSFDCSTDYYYVQKKFFGTIDYSKIKGLERLCISGKGHKNLNCIDTLKSLRISGYKQLDLSELFSSTVLDTLSMIQCNIKSLDGIQRSSKMQCLYLDYNRSLLDISALKYVKHTLKSLRILNSPKITDFSVLEELEELETLVLFGSNTLPNLDFIPKLKNLKTFAFNMNVENGDLTPCLNLRYALSERNRKHYNLKDKDLPKDEIIITGNENIDIWRRLE